MKGYSNNISGKGKKTAKALKITSGILGTLAAIGGLGGLDKNNSREDNLNSIIGGLVLGGTALGLRKLAKKHEGKGMSGSGRKIMPHHHDIIHDLLKHPKKIHISDLKFSAAHIKKIHNKCLMLSEESYGFSGVKLVLASS